MCPSTIPTSQFALYKALCLEAEALFTHVRESHPDCVACAPGCDECCHSLFELTLIEAVYLNHVFARTFPEGAKRDAILKRARTADKAVRDIKARTGGIASGEKMRCPLLSDKGRCLLYDARPMTCRVFGIPMTIDGTNYICPQSRFVSGTSYPAADLSVLRSRLTAISLDLARHMKNEEVAAELVPVSTALLASYKTC